MTHDELLATFNRLEHDLGVFRLDAEAKIEALERQNTGIKNLLEVKEFQLEESEARVDLAVEALNDIFGWLKKVEESGIRYVCLGAKTLLLQHKKILSNKSIERYLKISEAKDKCVEAAKKLDPLLSASEIKLEWHGDLRKALAALQEAEKPE